MKIHISVLAIVLFCSSSWAQENVPVDDTNPASLKWYRLNTTNFRILYPRGFESQAQRMANTLETIYAPEAKTMGSLPNKISVILQNQSAISNGFVSITPRRSEFYAMPSQNYNFTGNNDWLNLLATHEYRHIVQYQHSRRGFNKLFYYLFGNNVLSGMANAAAPAWFWEGDAVATETAFTSSGRGRIPNFDLVFRTNLLEGRTFNYHKQYLRSYKHNIPNHYVLGYNMVSYLRQRTGDPEIWSKVTVRSWNVPFIPFRFSSALKKETGLYVVDLYKEMAKHLKDGYAKQQEGLTPTLFENVNRRTTQAYTDYLYPQEVGNGQILAVKSGIGDIERLVLISPLGETKVFVQGFINEAGMLSANDNIIVWNEYRYDPRWRARNYSVIMSYDRQTGTKRQLTHRTRYAGAALSPDGSKVATVETTTEYGTRLVVIDFITGAVLKQFDNPSNHFISMPRWYADGRSIVALETQSKGKLMVKFDFESGARTILEDFKDENVGHPVPVGKYVIYNSPASGIDNIYALDAATGEIFQITSARYGAYNATLSKDGEHILYNNQGRDGMDVVKIPFDPGSWKPFNRSIQPNALADMLAEQEGQADLLSKISEKKFEARRYHRITGMINPYSWGAYFTNTLAQADIGVSSKDVLSTTTLNAGYRYDINERTGAWRTGVSYQGFYPILDFELTQGTREVNTSIFSRTAKFKWNETGVLGGVRLPLLLTKSKYFSELEIGNSIGLIKTSSFTNELRSSTGALISTGTDRYVLANDTLLYSFNDRVSGDQLVYNQFKVEYTHALKTSRRDFNPKFGQFIALENYSTPYGGGYRGSLTAVRGTLYFPGLAKHHSIFFKGGYQQSLQSTDLDIYTFRNRIFRPRGHSFPREKQFLTLSANYALPVWYPDISLGPLLNIQRIKCNFFYDYGNGKGESYFYRLLSNNTARIYYTNNDAVYTSFGTEVTFDVNIMRLLPQFELGFRATYAKANKFNNSGLVVEFLLGNIPF